MRQVTKAEFLDYWERNIIDSKDIIVVGDWVVAKKYIHANDQDNDPVEIVYVVV